MVRELADEMRNRSPLQLTWRACSPYRQLLGCCCLVREHLAVLSTGCFNLQYQEEAACTLEFIHRRFVGINWQSYP
ncbi:hypothetical protein MHYP_G00310550 [Metynnis hypsauchen]